MGQVFVEPGLVLGAGNTEVNKRSQSPCPQPIHSREQDKLRSLKEMSMYPVLRVALEKDRVG